MTDELIREINEAVQRDRWQTLWTQYGTQILYGCLAIACAAGGLLYWQNHQQSLAQERTALLMQGREYMGKTNFAEARDLFTSLAADSKGHTQTLAYLWLGKTEMSLGNDEGATDAFAKAVGTSINPDHFQVLACIQGALLAPTDERFATCLPTKPEQPFSTLSAEHQIIMSAIKNENQATDIAALGALPPTQKRRMDDLASYLMSFSESDAE